jgi:hypothetical protein
MVIVDLLLETQQQISLEEQKNDDLLMQTQLKGQLVAYQSLLKTKITQEEANQLLEKQVKIFNLEQHLKNLQQNQEQLTQQIEISPK